MSDDDSDLDALWNSAPATGRPFDRAAFAHLPGPVQRYLAHAIAAGTPLASAVRLRMHGTIKLSRWRPFRAEEVIVGGRGMIWRAVVRMFGMPIRGFDRFVDGAGTMCWSLFGALPLLRASGPDITRSAADRVAAESVWLPSLLCADDVVWRVADTTIAHARFALAGHRADLALTLNEGRLMSVEVRRWGNPEGGRFRELDFGALIDQEATFGGYTVPARLRVGWHFGTGRFETEGKFLQVTIDDAVYR
jgi:hypothetical protein